MTDFSINGLLGLGGPGRSKDPDPAIFVSAKPREATSSGSHDRNSPTPSDSYVPLPHTTNGKLYNVQLGAHKPGRGRDR